MSGNVRTVENARFYPVIVDGRYHQYPSVTTILSIVNKPQLDIWRGKLGNEEADRLMNEAGDIGTAVHDGIHAMNMGGLPDDPLPLVSEILHTYANWAQANIEEILHVEEPVYSHRNRFAGTPDLICRMNGDERLCLIDFKTSKGIWPEMELQLAGYSIAVCEEHTEKYQNMRRLIVRLDKENLGKIQVKEFEGTVNSDNAFLYALGLYRFLRQ